jgi:hypothetical protein
MHPQLGLKPYKTSDFSTRDYVLYHACGRVIGQKFWPVQSMLVDSKAVARQAQTLILQEKIKKSG